jgi:hypothetical protein
MMSDVIAHQSGSAFHSYDLFAVLYVEAAGTRV